MPEREKTRGRRHGPLRPNVYAAELARTILAAVESRDVLDVAREARRISEMSGFSPASVARDLVDDGVAARINLEIPATNEFRRARSLQRLAGRRPSARG
jgi:hypothetical protein